MSRMGIWVTDAMLMQAIEHHQHQGSKQPCRRISSHTGPLESRRRANRRHMTGFMPTSQPFPPIWQFDVGPSTLQWEPPTSQEHRLQKRHQLSISSLLNSFVGWLKDPNRTHSPDESLSRADTTPAIMSPEPVREAETPESVLLPDMPEEIVRFRTSILSNVFPDDDKLLQITRVCCQSLRRSFESGMISAKSLSVAWEPLDDPCRSFISTTKMANKITAIIRHGLLLAVRDAHRQNPRAAPDDLWLVLMDHLSASPGDSHDIHLLHQLLLHMPTSIKQAIPLWQLNRITSTFVAAQASRNNLLAHWITRTARFSQAIQALGADQRRALDDSMVTFLQQQDWVSAKAKRMRFSWLLIKAHDAGLTTEQVIHTYLLCTAHQSRLNGLQRWQFLVARLGALAHLTTKSIAILSNTTYTSMADRWSSLLEHITLCSSSAQHPALRELCTILSRIGEFSSTIRVLTSPPVHQLSRHVMEALAIACDSHVLALELHDVIDSKPRPNRRQPLWSWTVWTSYVEAMIKDSALDPARTWQVLNLTFAPRGAHHDVSAKLHLLDQMGRWFAQAPHLSDRQVLRNVQRCVQHQRALTGGSVSTQTLVNVTGVVARDLERGQRGRTSRLRWLLALVEQIHGPRHAEDVEAALSGWRWTVAQSGHDERGPY